MRRILLCAFLAAGGIAAAQGADIVFVPDGGTPPDWRGDNGLVFAADSATLAFEGDGAGVVATVRRAPEGVWQAAPLKADGPDRWLLDLPERGWYDIRVTQAKSTEPSANLQPQSSDLQSRSDDLTAQRASLKAQRADLTLTVAVVGEPIPEAWRTNSVFGIWNVHGDPALIRLAGARWNRRMTSFRDVTPDDVAKYGDIEIHNAENSSLVPHHSSLVPHHSSLVTRHSSLAEGVTPPYGERDGLRQVGVFSFGMPLWTMDMPEGIKLPSFGNPFYPAKDWDDVTRCVAAYARTHALPRDMSIYNEPLTHFKGQPAQIADYARAVRAGLLRADPSFRVGGPGLYSIHIANLTKIESGDLLKSLDFLDMHAYVGGTPPEKEFIAKIDMLNDWLAAHGRADMPVYLTEFGWTAAHGTWQPPVDRATQARYVARSLALAWSRGVDALVYFALDFRTKKAGEAAFSLIGPGGRPEAGYAAFAAVSRHFAASEPIGHFSLAPGVHMVAGRRDGRLQLMVWQEDGAPLPPLWLPWRIESARGLYGEVLPWDADGGSPTSDLLFLETARMVLPSLHCSLAILPAVETTALPQPNELDNLFGGFACASAGGELPDGDYAAFVRCTTGGYAIRSYRLHSPIAVEDARLVWPADCDAPVLESDIASHETNRTCSADVSLDRGDVRTLTLAPGERKTVRFTPATVVPGERRRSTLRLELPDGAVRERSVKWTALPVFAATDANDAPFADFSDWAPFGEVPTSVADCRAAVRLSHDSGALTVEVEVKDDEHAPSVADPSRLWERDSIQLGFDMDTLKPWEAGFAGGETSQTLGGHRVFEFSVSDAGDGTGIAYLERSWDDALPAGTVRSAIEARVLRDPATAVTRYRVRIPWTELGAAESPPRPGDAIGFSLAVNDVDPVRHPARHGRMLFGGIVDDKEPRLFGPAWIRP